MAISKISMGGNRRIRLPKQEKELVGLLWRYLKLETVEKLTVATSFLIVALLLFAFGTCALFFLSAGVVKTLTSIIGDEAIANYIVGGVLVAVMAIVYFFRVRLIENRVVSSISASILRSEDDIDDDDDDDEDSEDDMKGSDEDVSSDLSSKEEEGGEL